MAKFKRGDKVRIISSKRYGTILDEPRRPGDRYTIRVRAPDGYYFHRLEFENNLHRVVPRVKGESKVRAYIAKELGYV